MTAKQKLTYFVILYALANLMVHIQIDRVSPGLGAGLDERLAWIDRSAGLHITFAIVAFALLLVLSGTYHVSRRVAASGLTRK